MDRIFAVAACMSGFVAVALGAFGAHGLKRHFETHADLQPIYQTAVEYHMFHALALFAAAWLAHKAPGSLTTAAGVLFLVGILIFCGSLYALTITNTRWLGAITPIGGVAFLAGWACLAVAAWRGLR